jgi:hypothetical protein
MLWLILPQQKLPMARWLRMGRLRMPRRQTLKHLRQLMLQLALRHQAVALAARHRPAPNKLSDRAALPLRHAPPYLITRSIHPA